MNDDLVKVEVPPLHYLEPDGDRFSPSIFFELPGREQSTLGANVTQGQNIHFAGDKIGFAPSRRNYQDGMTNNAQVQPSQSHSIKIEVEVEEESSEKKNGSGLNITLAVMGAVVGIIGGLLIVPKKANQRSTPTYNVMGGSPNESGD